MKSRSDHNSADPSQLRKDIVDDVLEEYRAYDPHDLLTNSETMHRWEEPPYFDYFVME